MASELSNNSSFMFDSDPMDLDCIRKTSDESNEHLDKLPLTELSPDQINCLDPFR